MKNVELFKPGTMLMVSWQAFRDFEPRWFHRQTWSPLITTETDIGEMNEKMKWNKIYLNLYDVTEMKYIKMNYKYIIDSIEL